MATDPKSELESILYQSRQLAGRLGSGSESLSEVTLRQLGCLKDAAQDIYDGLDDAPADIRDVYTAIVSLGESRNL
jgi:hypothetical protein